MSAAVDCPFHVGYHAPDVVFVEAVLSDEDVELVQHRCLAELDEGGEVYVTVNNILHTRLRLAHVVCAASDHERLLDTVRSLNSYNVADLCFRNLKSVALNQNLAVPGRPGAFLGNKLADADVAVVVNYKQHQLAPLYWSSLHLAAYGSARLSITHFRVLQNRVNRFVVDRVEPHHG